MKANFTAGTTAAKPWTAALDGGSDFYTYKAITSGLGQL